MAGIPTFGREREGVHIGPGLVLASLSRPQQRALPLPGVNELWFDDPDADVITDAGSAVQLLR